MQKVPFEIKSVVVTPPILANDNGKPMCYFRIFTGEGERPLEVRCYQSNYRMLAKQIQVGTKIHVWGRLVRTGAENALQIYFEITTGFLIDKGIDLDDCK